MPLNLNAATFRDLMQNLILSQVHTSTCEISDQCQAAYFSDVPEEMNFLYAHRRYAGCRTDDEYGATCAGAVSEEFPQKVVGRIVCQAVHAHGGGHKRHIVNNCADDTNDQHNDVLPSNGLIQPLCKRCQNMRMLQRGYRQQNTYKKH